MAFRKNSGRADNCCTECMETPCEPCPTTGHGDVWIECASLSNVLSKCGFEDPAHPASPCHPKTIYKSFEECSGTGLKHTKSASRHYTVTVPAGCVETCGPCTIVDSPSEAEIGCCGLFEHDGSFFTTQVFTLTRTGNLSGDYITTTTVNPDCSDSVTYSGTLTVDETAEGTTHYSGTLNVDPVTGVPDGMIHVVFFDGSTTDVLYSESGYSFTSDSTSSTFSYTGDVTFTGGYSEVESTSDLVSAANECFTCAPSPGVDCSAYAHLTWDETQYFLQKTVPTLHFLPASCYLKVWFLKTTTTKTTDNPCTLAPEVIDSVVTEESTFEWTPTEPCATTEQTQVLSEVDPPAVTLTGGKEVIVTFEVEKFTWVLGYVPTGLPDSGFPP